MKSAFLLACLLCALACGGCVSSDQPLSAIKDAKPDQRLAGQWKVTAEKPDAAAPDDGAQLARITYDPRGRGCLVMQQKDGSWKPDPAEPNFFVTRTAKATYLNLYENDETMAKPDHTDEGRYQFIKYEVSADGKTLNVAMLKREVIEKAVEEGKLRAAPKKSTPSKTTSFGVHLQDSPENILKFIESAPADIFQPVAQATREP